MPTDEFTKRFHAHQEVMQFHQCYTIAIAYVKFDLFYLDE